MNRKKVELGQFFTSKNLWLKPQILSFIKHSKCTTAYDPFAGGGDLLKAVHGYFEKFVGLDVDKKLKWRFNDSLLKIPHEKNGIIITNPPYIAKQSATRKNINLSKYFKHTKYDDVYLIALDKMLLAQEFVVAIIPESFINSNYMQKGRLNNITVLEENPFLDTENPVCVACFDGTVKPYSKIKIYKNTKLVGTLGDIEKLRPKPFKRKKITFNDKNGWLGLRAIDSTDGAKKILFDFKENIRYDWKHNIKVSSRHFSLIEVDVPKNKRQYFIREINKKLNDLRKASSDLLLTPFKGNTKEGKRRRRLDFNIARALIENTLARI